MLKVSLLTSALALAFSLPVYAGDVESRIDSIETKVQNLDAKLDQILTLLSQQAAPKASLDENITSLNTDNSAEVIDDEMAKLIALNSANEPKSKGLLMDVYVLDKIGEELPSKPTGFPIATLDYNKEAAFTFADHLKDKDVYSVAFNKTLGINYHGYIKINEPGKYVFSYDYESINSHYGGDRSGDCLSTVEIEGKPILIVKGANADDDSRGKKITSSDQSMVEFSSGYKQVNVWLTCTKPPVNPEQVFNNTFTHLRMKGPSDRKMSILSHGSLFHM